MGCAASASVGLLDASSEIATCCLSFDQHPNEVESKSVQFEGHGRSQSQAPTQRAPYHVCVE